MSKVPYTVNLDRFVCTELEDIRTMIKTGDYSGLAATVERIQYHGTAMEDALWDRKHKITKLKAKNKELKAKIKKLKE